MEESSLPGPTTVDETERFRKNLGNRTSREEFYRSVVYQSPADKVAEKTPTEPPSSEAESTSLEDVVATPKRSISEEILDVAYRTAREVTSAEDGIAVPPTSEAERSTTMIFQKLIVSSPCKGVEDEAQDAEDGPEVRNEDKPRFFSNRSSTLPVTLECKIYDGGKGPKLTRWEVFKRKFYLGAAHQTVSRAIEDPSMESGPSGVSKSEQVDSDGFLEVTDIEGLDLEGVPTMTQRSRKLFSWNRLKTGFGFKRKGKSRAEGEHVSVTSPDEEDALSKCVKTDTIHEDAEEDSEVELSEEKLEVEKDKLKEKGHSHSWLSEMFSSRLFSGRRRHEDPTEVRPSSAARPPPQFFEIESNW